MQNIIQFNSIQISEVSYLHDTGQYSAMYRYIQSQADVLYATLPQTDSRREELRKR